jgi:hypothetical protein
MPQNLLIWSPRGWRNKFLRFSLPLGLRGEVIF